MSAVAVVITALLGWGCDEGRASDVPDGLPARAEYLQGPGTELSDGFTVAEGSWLVGAVTVPDPWGAPFGNAAEGWRASLVTDERPLDVLQRYLDQAQRAGFEFVSEEYFLPSCVAVLPGGAVEPVPLTSAPFRARQVECTILAGRATPEDTFEELRLQLVLGPPLSCQTPCRQGYMRSLELDLVRGRAPNDPMFTDQRLGPDAPEVAALRLPEVPAPPKGLQLPDGGDEIGVDEEFFGGLVVEPGSAVIVPPTGTTTNSTGDLTVHLALTGDVRRVVQAYGRQLERIAGPDGYGGFRLESWTVEGRASLYGSVGDAGGVTGSVVTVRSGAAGPTFARLELGND
jgi:hypothetical protein